MRIAVLLPCLNEEAALPLVLPFLPPDARIVVCDNGSTDRSAEVARALGAEVVAEPRRGYGSAVQVGLRHLEADPPDVVVILDADGSADLTDLPALLAPLHRGEADLVMGERLTRGDPGSLTTPQRVGNVVATTLLRARTGVRYVEMGPFRALTWDAVRTLALVDPTWGWNVEMQMKAALRGLRVREIPVAWGPRVGTSKISGSLRGSIRAGGRILWACWRYA